MRNEIVIPFDGDSSQKSNDNLIKALEQQLEKYKTADAKPESKPSGPVPDKRVVSQEVRNL
jgi:hypothetical protein